MAAILEIVSSQKLIMSLADMAEHICQIKTKSDGIVFLKCPNELFVKIKRISDGIVFLKRANELFVVSVHSNQRVNDMEIKMSPKQLHSGM